MSEERRIKRLAELGEEAQPTRAFPIEEPDMKRRMQITKAGIRIKPLEELSPLEHLASIHDRLTYALYDMRSVLMCIQQYGEDTPETRACIVQAIKERQAQQIREALV